MNAHKLARLLMSLPPDAVVMLDTDITKKDPPEDEDFVWVGGTLKGGTSCAILTTEEGSKHYEAPTILAGR